MITLAENLDTINDGTTFSIAGLEGATAQAGNRSLVDIIDAADAYASARLEQIGEGTARNVYAISSHEIVKIAKDQNAIHQNAAEAKISKNAGPGAPIARVKQRCRPRSVWIVSERATPVIDASGFESASGQAWKSFEESIRLAVSGKKAAEPRSKLAQATYNLIYEHGLDLPDVLDVKHWGTLPDGQLVLFDYGELE